MNPSKHIFLNIHLYVLFDLINSQTSDKWRLKRLKNSSIYQFIRQYQNDHDQLDYDYDYPQHNQIPNYKDNNHSYKNSSVLSPTYRQTNKLSENDWHSIRGNSDFGVEKEDLDLTPIIPMSYLRGNEKLRQRAKQKGNKRDLICSDLMRPCGCGIINRPYMLGGETAKEFDYPWMGTLQVNGQFVCSVNIINEWWVLTVSQAFRNLTKNDVLTIRVGSIDRTKGKIYGVSKIIGKKYSRKRKNKDIGLMKIKGPIEFDLKVKPICLPKESDPPLKDGDILKVAGWGSEQFESIEPTILLKEINITLISNEKCADIYSEGGMTINEEQICTREEGKDACLGDAGGPAIREINGLSTIVGLVSYGKTCADDYPGVYTKVSNYIDWIKEVFDSK